MSVKRMKKGAITDDRFGDITPIKILVNGDKTPIIFRRLISVKELKKDL